MNNHISGKMAHASDLGQVRECNEDQAISLTNRNGENLLLVCDGMGGSKHGETASQIATDIFIQEFNKNPFIPTPYLKRHWIKKIAKKANKEIFFKGESNPHYKGMGTTLTIVLVNKSFLTVGQIGDSRAYVYDEQGEYGQITHDQSYVALLMEKGAISEEEMAVHPKRNRLMNALGVNKKLKIDLSKFKYGGQKIILCSDGLYTNVTQKQIADLIYQHSYSPEEKCKKLIDLANENGGNDNISVVYWEAE